MLQSVLILGTPGEGGAADCGGAAGGRVHVAKLSMGSLGLQIVAKQMVWLSQR
jgi:hypothetical protein